MKTCPKCSTTLEDDATSCVSCGFRMNTPQRTRIGIVVKWLFVIFNIAMCSWVLVAMGIFDSVDTTSQAKALPHGTENAAGMGVSMIVMVWLICNAVFGILLWDTRTRAKALQESNKIGNK